MKYKILLILIGAVVITLGLGITYSVFTSEGDLISTDQNIAKFIFNAEVMDEINLPIIDLKPGDVKKYNFEIKNNSQENLSDVTIDYQLIIKTYHIIPINIKLYRGNDNLILNCDESFSRNDYNELVCNTEVTQMEYSKKILNNYKIELSFDKEYNDVSYSKLVDYIDIEVKSWQK